jgi:5'-3' exonuclease
MNKVLLIDGSSLLSKSFHGNTPLEYQKAKTEEEYERATQLLLKTKDGVFVNGVFTMMKTLMRIIKNHSPQYLAVAWDLGREHTFRRVLYPAYKATRPETRPELKSQFALAQRILKEMNIAQFGFLKYEADDILGVLSHQLKSEIQVIVLTGDQDAIQLIDDQVSMWYMTRKAEAMYQSVGVNARDLDIPDNIFELNPMYVEEFYKMKPIQIIDFKAIAGDKSDNIPGVRNVGEKSIIPLLQEFETIEGIYDFLEDNDENVVKETMKSLGISKNPAKNLLMESDDELVGKASAKLSKRLATICLEIEELQDVQLQDLKLNINEVGKQKIYEELEFNSLIQNYTPISA